MLPMAWMALRAGLPLDNDLTLLPGWNRFCNQTNSLACVSPRSGACCTIHLGTRRAQLHFRFADLADGSQNAGVFRESDDVTCDAGRA
jgi:hypothetical protein